MDLAAIFKSHAAYLKGETEGERADFSGQDLRGRDFSGQDLREADFSKADVREASFVGCKLCDTDFSGSDARDANFSHADLTNANTSESNMMGADFTGAKVDYDNLNLGARRRHGVGDAAPADGFPLIWSYQGNSSDGTPLMTSPGVFDQSIITALGKRHLVTVTSAPWTNTGQPSNQNVVSRIRAASIHPTQKVLIYDLHQYVTQNLSSNTLAGQIWLLVLGPPDRRTYYDSTHSANGNPPFGVAYQSGDPAALGGLFYDMGSGGTQGHTPLGTTLAALWKQFNQGKADGYFFDVLDGTPWNSTVDVARTTGYANVAAMNAAAMVETQAFVNAMVGTGLCWFNRGMFTVQLDDATAFKMTGELYESWDPDQGAGAGAPPFNAGFSFDQIMAIAMSRPWVTSNPTGFGTTLIKSEQQDSNTPGSGIWEKNSRFGLGSACILGGYHTMWKANHDATAALWWADEYSVVLPGGVSDATGAHMGWLGMPLEAGHSTGTTGCYLRRFQNGIVAVNGDATIAHNIDLGRPYKRITGSQFPSVNNGAIEQVVSVPGKDARFYVNA
jgi:hypothetical protein